MRAWVHQRAGAPSTDAGWAAARALADAGWEVTGFDDIAAIDVRADEPVIGGIPTVVAALESIGAHLPDLDHPPALRHALLDPDVRETTMGWVRQHPEAWPLFVKPTTGRKEFGGLVIRSTSDLLLVTSIDDALPVFAAHAVDLSHRVEWRAFVIDGRIRDVRPYRGCPDLQAPPLLWLQLLVDQWASVPAGCTLDVVDIGDPDEPDWRVIECNDGYSIAPYGLARNLLAELLVRRWCELAGIASLWP